MLAWLLGLSLLGLSLGPLLAAFGRGRAEFAAALDGITLGLVPALIVTRLLPHTWASLGVGALVAFGAGFMLLFLADSLHHVRASAFGKAMVVPALAVHALSDGAALAVATSAREVGHAGTLLGIAVVLHRLPEGLFLATTLGRSTGARGLALRLSLLGAATIVGAFGSQALLAHVPDAAFDAVTAFGLGAMLRLVLHSHGDRPEGTRARAVSGVAMVLGLIGAVAIPAQHDVFRMAQPLELTMAQSIVPLFVETAPALALGIFGASLITVSVPARSASSLAGESSFRSAVAGLRYAVGLPICSCAVRSLTRALADAGVPAGAVVAVAIATPELAFDALPMSIRLLGVGLSIARLAIVAAMSVAAAMLVARFSSDSSSSFGGPPAPPADVALGPRPRLGEALVSSFHHTGAWYLAGLAIASALEAALPTDFAARAPWFPALIVLIVVALPIYACAPGVTPIAAMLLHKGFSPGLVLAFLALGPTIHLALLRLFRDLFGARAATMATAGCVAVAVLAGATIDAFGRRLGSPELHPLIAHSHSNLEWFVAASVAACFAASVVTLGARGFMESLFGEIAARDEACEHPEHAGHHAHGHHH
jgi:uncharacterized membrane protein YraQ (UPF0718 family)